MASTAFITQYREEFIPVFERGESLLRASAVTEAMIKGNTATFLTAGSGDATAVTRGVNGLIPARNDSLTQTSATLLEWHDLVEKTGFNIFASQGNQRAIMQMTSAKVIHRKIDDQIIEQLDTATQDTATAVTGSLNLVMKAKTILGNGNVPVEEEDNMFGLITPAFDAYLMQTKEYASADYVDVKPFSGPSRKYKRWAGVNWIIHSGLTGVGTSSEKCYLYHRNAIGHAVDRDRISPAVGYDDRQDFSWARTTVFAGAALLQNTGVVQMLHDGSEYVAA